MQSAFQVRHANGVALGVALLALAGPACREDALQPDWGAGLQEIVAGDTVQGVLATPSDAPTFLFRPPSGGEAAVFLAANGAVGVTVSDSALRYVADVGIGTGQAGRPITARRTAVFPVAANHPYRLRVGPSLPGGVGTYRFVVYVVDRAPESRSATLAVGDTVATEVLGTSADIDDFTFAGRAGEEYVAFVQGLGTVPAGRLHLRVLDASGSTLAEAANDRGDGELEAQGTPRVVLPSDGSYRVSVSFGCEPADPVWPLPFRFRALLRRVDRAPERHAATLALGDTVNGEAVDFVGDVDEFRFTAAAGRLVDVFLQALSDSAGRVLSAELLGPPPFSAVVVTASAGDTGLYSHGTGRVALPVAGTYTVRISGAPEPGRVNRGPYRAFVYGFAAEPETRAPAFAVGDSIAGEGIGAPGDLDEYTTSLADSTLVNLVLWRDAPVAASLVATLVRTSAGEAFRRTAAVAEGTGLPGLGSGRFVAPPGTYTLTVDGGSGTSGGYAGAYRVQLHRIAGSPETAAAAIAIGDTVSAEALSPLGDYDVFHFHGTRLQAFNVMLQRSAPGTGSFTLSVAETPPQFWTFAWVSASDAAPTLTAHQTGRFELPHTGEFTIAVRGGANGLDVGEQGPYRIALVPWPVGPETAAAALVPGDSVVTERLDSAGDLDEFTITAAPGSFLQIVFQAAGGVARLLTDDTLGLLATLGANGMRNAFGRTAMPGSGRLRIRIGATGWVAGTQSAAADPYGLWVDAISPLPERVAPAIALGDTVAGESIDPVGDFDEFQLAAASGDSLVAGLQPLPGTNGHGLRLSVRDADGRQIASTHTGVGYLAQPDLSHATTGVFVIPASGTYTVRVEGAYGAGTVAGDRETTGAYRLLVRRAS
jgi:hypothetical protein